MEVMIKSALIFFESPIPWLINGFTILFYLLATKKATLTPVDCCRCADKRVGGGNLLGGAAAMSFGSPSLFLFYFLKLDIFWTMFEIQAIYSTIMLVVLVLPKLLKDGTVLIESHAGGEVSLCGMVAALNIGPLYWVSKIPGIGIFIFILVDIITTVHHVFASIILGICSLGRIKTGFSESQKPPSGYT